MNISSVLINAKKDKQERLLKEINSIKNCSVELVEDEKIIVIIESENLDEELSSYKKLEKLEHIISINMVFSYQDLDEDMQKIMSANIENIANEQKDAKDIKYSGNINDKF